MVLKDELMYALTCMKVYYGESTHQLFFPATKNQTGHGLTLQREQILIDLKSFLIIRVIKLAQTTKVTSLLKNTLRLFSFFYHVKVKILGFTFHRIYSLSNHPSAFTVLSQTGRLALCVRATSDLLLPQHLVWDALFFPGICIHPRPNALTSPVLFDLSLNSYSIGSICRICMI